jgi:hypothetical protein
MRKLAAPFLKLGLKRIEPAGGRADKGLVHAEEAGALVRR